MTSLSRSAQHCPSSDLQVLPVSTAHHPALSQNHPCQRRRNRGLRHRQVSQGWGAGGAVRELEVPAENPGLFQATGPEMRHGRDPLAARSWDARTHLQAREGLHRCCRVAAPALLKQRPQDPPGSSAPTGSQVTPRPPLAAFREEKPGPPLFLLLSSSSNLD
uniref:Uncharacterized protein n=1 Tax=Myotis myotis TaxID=51298 RepID=A0A7J7T657_MYOMY|nr:hypothetical protein mMyoMyo1_009127 [Myotis myotis]